MVVKLFGRTTESSEAFTREELRKAAQAVYEIGYQDGGMLPEHIFTFGSQHVHPDTGASLGTRYVVIRAAAPEEARAIMVLYFGTKWSHQYASREEAEVQKYECIELVPSEWPKVPGGRA